MEWIWGGLMTALQWLCIEWFFALDRGWKKRIFLGGLLAAEWASACYLEAWPAGLAAGWVTLDFFLVFYSDGSYPRIRYCLAAGAALLISCVAGWAVGPDKQAEIAFIVFAGLLYLLAAFTRGQKTGVLFVTVLGLTAAAGYFALAGFCWQASAALCLALGQAEYIYSSYSASFRKSTAEFQEQVMLHHYEEVKAVYLNMRGWRHDYHNHIQTLKAWLQLGQTEEAKTYLNELEDDLDSVDQLVKSGNVMMDAVLNSKLTLAKEKNIAVDCKAVLPERLSIGDTDLCVIAGNLLDNAIESCGQIAENRRFIRIYCAVVRRQFYLSVVNAAKEELDFNEKNYISSKRGEHGHGMKRVKLAVDRYGGYLNLKNEPGVFASEVMLPLEESGE